MGSGCFLCFGIILDETFDSGVTGGYIVFMTVNQKSKPLTNAERQARWRDKQRGGPPKKVVRPKCGQPGGYQAHRVRGEEPCGKCKPVWAAMHRKTADYTLTASVATFLKEGPYKKGARGLSQDAKDARDAVRGGLGVGKVNKGTWTKLRVTIHRRGARDIARQLQVAVADGTVTGRQATTFSKAAQPILDGPK